MPSKQGKCIFCRGQGKLTKQHVWPRWLKKINQPYVSNHTQFSGGAKYDAPDAVRITEKRRQGHSGTRTARKICKTCNNGWVERLEENIRAPLTRIMIGGDTLLDADLRRQFSAWLCLVTIMAEFMDSDTISIPPADYRYLYNNGEPPPEWKIWIARYVGFRHDLWVFRHYGMQLADFPDVLAETHKCDTQVTTFVIGQLCVHTFRSTVLVPPDAPDYEILNMPRIWPLNGSDIDWPNVRELSDAGVEHLSARIIDLIDPAPNI